MRILAIDPGFAAMGVGVIESLKGRLLLIHSATVRTLPGKSSDESRLDSLGKAILAAIVSFEPEAMGYENQAGVEVGAQLGRGRLKSSASSRRVHEVSGMIRAFALAFELPCYCIAPISAKCALLGKGGGHAPKSQIKRAVQRLFGVKSCSEHAADALAIGMGSLKAHREAKLRM